MTCGKNIMKSKKLQMKWLFASMLWMFTLATYAEPLLVAFKTPDDCIKIPVKAGLAPIGNKVEWVDLGIGYASQTTIKTHKGNLSKVGDVDNDVGCYFEGQKEYIESVTIRANCFNSEGTAATIEKFRQVVELLATELKIDDPKGILKNVDPVKGKTIDGATYKITVTKLPYKIGFGWRLKIETK